MSFGYCHPENGLTLRTQSTPTPMKAFEQQPYNGATTKLCLAFDIGTSFSSISYCILHPDQVPVIRNVNRYLRSYPRLGRWLSSCRFPRQRHADRIEKVPSVIYYDQAGELRAIGAETLDPETNAEAADESWIKIAWQVPHLGLCVPLSTPYALIGSSCFLDLRGRRNSVTIVPFPRTRRKETCFQITSNISMTAAENLLRGHIGMACASGNPYTETHNLFLATQPPGVERSRTHCESAWFRAACFPTPILVD